MSKPVRPARIISVEGFQSDAVALFDTGSFHSFVRQDKLPAGALVPQFKVPKSFGTAETGGKVVAAGEVPLQIHVENHDIGITAFVAANLSADLIIGAGEMQRWDITVKNDNGHTSIHIGRDMNDPDIQTVL